MAIKPLEKREQIKAPHTCSRCAHEFSRWITLPSQDGPTPCPKCGRDAYARGLRGTVNLVKALIKENESLTNRLFDLECEAQERMDATSTTHSMEADSRA